MNNISILGWIAIAATVLLELATTMVFLYQRTLRKLARKIGVDQRRLVFLYPRYMLVMYRISLLKWPLYIYILYVNWIVTISIFVLTFALSIALPVVDWRHLLTMRRAHKKHFYDMPRDVYATILAHIDGAIVKTGYDITTLDEYRIVHKYVSVGIADDAIAALLSSKTEVSGEPNLFLGPTQARVHIAMIRYCISGGKAPMPSFDHF